MTLPHFPLEDGTADCESSIFGEFEKDIESVYRLGSDASKVRSSLASLCRFIDRIPAPGGVEELRLVSRCCGLRRGRR